MFTKSIKWRLLAWMAGLLTIILAGLGVALYEIHVENRIGRLDEQLRLRVALLGVTLYAPGFGSNDQPPGPPDGDGDPPPPPDDNFTPPPPDDARPGPPSQSSPPDKPGMRTAQLPAATARLFEENKGSGFYFALWSDGEEVPFKKTANLPAGETRPQPARHDTETYVRTEAGFREVFHATERGDCVLAGRSLAPEFAEARRFAGWLFLGGGGVLALVLGGGWWLVDRALKPVEKISAAALKISSGDLSQRISVAETESELGRLAAVLNSTFARLEASFAQQKQFTADASHELRTPLAVLISEAQTTLARERTPADYQESMAACLDTAQKMRQLTESLLVLARLDAGQEVLHREKTDLAVMVRNHLRHLGPLAAARQLRIHCNLAPAETIGDVTRLGQVITNLLTNAINYNHDGGEIVVATSVNNHRAILTVTNTGSGIAAADLPRVFERFYRADPSRSHGGNGLGLSICKAIVVAHGGTIDVSSGKDSATIFTVTLPAAASEG